MGAYEMAINNVARYISNSLPKMSEPEPYSKKETAAFDVFDASSVLSVVFCKSKEEIAFDVINAKIEEG